MEYVWQLELDSSGRHKKTSPAGWLGLAI